MIQLGRRRAKNGDSMHLVGLILVLLTLATPASSSQQTSVSSPQVCNVRGRVVDDLGTPVRLATVTISGPGAASQLSDGTGRFEFTDIPRGTVLLTASKPGLFSGASGQLRPDGQPQQLTLTDEVCASAVAITLWRPAAVEGIVRDDSGEPLVSVPVKVFRAFEDGHRPKWRAVTSTSTDDRGAFRLSGLLPARYLVAVTSTYAGVPSLLVSSSGVSSSNAARELSEMLASASSAAYQPNYAPFLSELSGLAPPDKSIVVVGTWITSNLPVDVDADGGTRVFSTSFYPGASAPSGAQEISLGSGEERLGLDIVVRSESTFSIDGRVVSAGVPVPRVSLTVRSAMDDAGFPLATAISDTAGTFAFPLIPAGHYVLSGNMRPPPRRGDEPLSGSIEISVGEGPAGRIELTMTPGHSVSGAVEFTGGSAPLPHEVQQIQIIAEPIDPTEWPVRTLVSGDGRFVLTNLPGAGYYLRAVSPAGGWVLDSITRQTQNLAESVVSSVRDETDVVVRFTLKPSELAGRVTSGGRVDTRASVILFPADGAVMPALGTSSRRLVIARVSDSGEFSIVGAPRGEYYVAAVPDALASDWASDGYLRRLVRHATRVLLREGRQTTELQTVEGFR